MIIKILLFNDGNFVLFFSVYATEKSPSQLGNFCVAPL